MSMYLFLLFLTGLAAAAAILFRGRFEQALPCCVFYVILVLYVSGLVAGFMPGFYLVLLTLPAVGVLCLVRRGRTLVADFRAAVLTPGFFFFIAAMCLMLPCITNMRINSWDEFSHWGTVIKNFWYLDDFANLENATTHFKGYPPAASLFAWFAQKFGRNYVECKSYLGYNVFYVAMLCPAFCMIREKQEWFKAIALAFCCILLPTVTWLRVYDVTYVDGLLGVETAVLFFAYLFFENRRWRNVTICLATAVLCLTKASGAGLAGISMLIMAVSEWGRSGNGLREKLKGLLLPGMMLVSLLAGKCSWDLYLKASGTREAWDTSGLNLKSLGELFAGNAPQYRYEAAKNFWRTVCREPVSDGFVGLSCLGWVLLFIALTAVIFWLTRGWQSAWKERACAVGLICATPVYAVSLLLLYLFTYSENEALTAASFNRYMGTWLTAVFAVLVIAVFSLMRKKVWWKSVALSVVVASVTYLPVYRAFFTATPVCSEIYRDYPLDVRFQAVKEELDQWQGGTPKVYFVHQKDSSYWYWICRYGLTPYQVQESNEAFSFERGTPVDSWAEQLSEGGFTHVFLNHVDEDFLGSFGALFEAEEEIVDAGLYEIAAETDGIVLKMVRVF